MRRLYLLVTIPLFLSFESFGQKDWESKFNGLVITEDSSIIKGFLRFEVGTIDRGKQIKLSKKPNDTPQIFYTLELRGYIYKRDTFIIIHNLQPFDDDTKIINKAEARIVQSGKLTLLKVEEVYFSRIMSFSPTQTGSQTTSDLTKTTSALTNEYTDVIQDKRGKMIGIKKQNFKNSIKLLLTDAPDLLNQIENNTLGYSDLDRIVKSYNQRFR